ncbi:hypothetical protein BDY19DRAFT_988676 [Irpex rosettiformis]|uniref:Uncharacterized protein n=1 Tax=Irpex rosettiformis TaxID=378272 RepID=A0ACB8UKZ7_9APHY|nr:hypothetical protein BDY19DRAFT_988676 [Irpex rosettiformis]
MAQNGDNPSISIPVGITIGLIASFVQSLGLTIQRKSHVLNQNLPEGERKVEHRRPLWLLGFGIFISSNLFGSIFQIASLPVVILAPLGAVSLLWNAFFARLILGDVFSPWMVFSTLCIAGGAVLIAEFGIVPEPTHSLEDLLALFSRPAFIVYFSLLGVFTLVALAITHAVEYSSSRRIALPVNTPPLSPLLQPSTDPTILTTAGLPNSERDDTSERTPLIDNKTLRSSSFDSFTPYLSSSKIPMFLAMSYASFSGIISGMCLLLAKSGVELLVLTVAGKNQFFMWQSWALVLGLVVCALLQLWYMHKSLVLADPTLVCPLAFCFYNLSSIINGLIYFDQFGYLSTLHLLLVILGIIILLTGVWIVSFPPGGQPGGIDLGTWSEESECDARSHISDEFIIHYEDEPLPLDSSHAIQDETIGMENVSSRDSSRRPCSVGVQDSQDAVATLSLSSHAAHLRRQTEPVMLSPTERMDVSPESPTSPTSTRRRTPYQSTLGYHPLATSRQSFPPHPLSPGAPSGFSIGLSPVSPGFALIPRERGRRRRVTSVEGDPHLLERGTLRRAFSDGSVAQEESGEGRGEGDEQVVSPAMERDIEASGLHVGGDQSSARWRWLPNLFASRRTASRH